jgi:hypothetical protein
MLRFNDACGDSDGFDGFDVGIEVTSSASNDLGRRESIRSSEQEPRN